MGFKDLRERFVVYIPVRGGVFLTNKYRVCSAERASEPLVSWD